MNMRKIRDIACFIALLGFMCWSFSAVIAAENTRDFLIIVDPGHGGSQLGAKGVTGLKEKQVVLQIAKKIYETLKHVDGLKVVMTRDKDIEVPLWDRVVMANKAQADLFISVHSNAFSKRSVGGVETFFHSIEASGEEAKRVAKAENAPAISEKQPETSALSFILQDMQQAERLRDSSRFAHMVQAELGKALQLEDLGVMQADFIVLRGTTMPSVLLEIGFLTNRRDERILRWKKTHNDVAKAVKRAVLAYRELIKKKQVTVNPESSKH